MQYEVCVMWEDHCLVIIDIHQVLISDTSDFFKILSFESFLHWLLRFVKINPKDGFELFKIHTD